ncbi:uridine diphosphate glucose pyrophosphatase NUDT14-like [Tubulanus polymorphus]|uniref:uridine diphosphate glucose pyrophosphatase NUDT14-like n=1 Tax=Tubulanus polymorphus TaxID=672921 RepID=UPI003DA4598F
MENVTDFVIEPMKEQSKYIVQCRINYKQDGKSKIWDAIQEHESVCILIYNMTKDCFVFVSQFRPGVYLNSARRQLGRKEMQMFGAVDPTCVPPKLGISYEMCAGLVDKDMSLEKTAQMECLEECGYDVPLANIEKITSYRTGLGLSGAQQTLYYAEVTDDMKVSLGGGLDEEGEMIEVLHIPLKDSRKLLTDDTIPKSIGLLYGIMWFYENKKRPE